jgi:Cu-Zn family superoxide dismutase
VRIVADITGLKPGQHGFHAHENDDCSSPDAKSAGGHVNPGALPAFEYSQVQEQRF